MRRHSRPILPPYSLLFHPEYIKHQIEVFILIGWDFAGYSILLSSHPLHPKLYTQPYLELSLPFWSLLHSEGNTVTPYFLTSSLSVKLHGVICNSQGEYFMDYNLARYTPPDVLQLLVNMEIFSSETPSPPVFSLWPFCESSTSLISYSEQYYRQAINCVPMVVYGCVCMRAGVCVVYCTVRKYASPKQDLMFFNASPHLTSFSVSYELTSVSTWSKVRKSVVISVDGCQIVLVETRPKR